VTATQPGPAEAASPATTRSIVPRPTVKLAPLPAGPDRCPPWCEWFAMPNWLDRWWRAGYMDGINSMTGNPPGLAGAEGVAG